MFRLTNTEVWLLVEILQGEHDAIGFEYVRDNLLKRLQADLQDRNDAAYDLKDDDGDDNILEAPNVRS